MFRMVNLEKCIPGEELEKLLIESAKDIGLKARSIDEFETEYNLGSVEKETIYSRTELRLRGKILPLIQIKHINKNEMRDYFLILTGFDTLLPFFGFASEKLVENI